LKLLFIACGTNDSLIGFGQRVHEYCVANNINHVYWLIQGGGHDFNVWKPDCGISFKWQMKPD